MMRRTIEVGRAVLSSSSTHQELWLTTLITLSQQQQQLINFEQLSVNSLLNHLSSGNIWVERGREMHIKFRFTHGKEPLANQSLETLIASILAAPVWEQLSLQPSWISGLECELGTARIALNRSTDDGSAKSKKIHRIFSNVPAMDMKPPEGIPRVVLDSVMMSMDILDSRQRMKIMSVKHSRTSAKKNDLPVPQRCHGESTAMEQHTSRQSSLATGTHAMHLEEGSTCHTVKRQDNSQKRKRAPDTDTVASSPVLSHSSDVHRFEAAVNPASSEKLVDGALRLAVCGVNKAVHGIKVRASSFDSGLADLIPELWSPGFLRSMSTRAQLLPVVSRSLVHSASARATSLSLKNKMARLEAISPREPLMNSAKPASTPDLDIGKDASPITCRLWLHLRKNLCKSTTSLPSFVASDAKTAIMLASDEPILEQSEQRSGDDDVLSSQEVEYVDSTSCVGVTPGDTEDDTLLLDTGIIG